MKNKIITLKVREVIKHKDTLFLKATKNNKILFLMHVLFQNTLQVWFIEEYSIQISGTRIVLKSF